MASEELTMDGARLFVDRGKTRRELTAIDRTVRARERAFVRAIDRLSAPLSALEREPVHRFAEHARAMRSFLEATATGVPGESRKLAARLSTEFTTMLAAERRTRRAALAALRDGPHQPPIAAACRPTPAAVPRSPAAAPP